MKSPHQLINRRRDDQVFRAMCKVRQGKKSAFEMFSDLREGLHLCTDKRSIVESEQNGDVTAVSCIVRSTAAARSLRWFVVLCRPCSAAG